MTIIWDGSGVRWLDVPQRKRRARSRGGRFSELSVGEQLVQVRSPGATLRDGLSVPLAPVTGYAVVTDLWFDPVKGQDNEWSGQMVGIRVLDAAGEMRGPKQAYSRHALAAIGFKRAEMDYVAFCQTRRAEMDAGKVVGIGVGRALRRRPKMPGGL